MSSIFLIFAIYELSFFELIFSEVLFQLYRFPLYQYFPHPYLCLFIHFSVFLQRLQVCLRKKIMHLPVKLRTEVKDTDLSM